MELTKTENTFLKLSIQVRLNGLSFCMLQPQENGHEVVWYKKLDFKKEFNPVKILEQIELFYQNEKQLQQEMGEVILLFSNDLYSFVPQEFFKEEEASHYLKFTTKILKTDVVSHDVIPARDMANVYIPLINITNYLFDRYGEFEYKHSSSVLVQAVLDYNKKEGPQVFLNNFDGYYDLVVIEGDRLLLCNTFTYETKEDFIYYLLFTAEQLNLDPQIFTLHLSGMIHENSTFYQIAYTYIRNIEFLEPQLKLSPAEYRKPQFQREALLLLKSLQCE